jgi:hypothetical protein
MAYSLDPDESSQKPYHNGGISVTAASSSVSVSVDDKLLDY